MNKTKTNVMRVLDKASIPYRTMEYEVDESDLSGVHVAEQLGTALRAHFQDAGAQRREGRPLCVLHSRGSGAGSEKSGPGMQGKESGNVAVKGAAADHGLHPGAAVPPSA